MALDGLFLHTIINELNESLIDGKVLKINQPEKDEIILSIRTVARENIKLLISSSASYPRMHLTNVSKQNPLTAPLFTMVLRKYLTNAKILSISQIGNDRICKMTFKTTDELGFNSEYSLYIEIMGRHSNISLVRDRDSIIMDTIKHVSFDVNRVRSLLPNMTFELPPQSEKLNPLDFSKEEFDNFVSNNNIEFDNNFCIKTFTGIGKDISTFIYNKCKDSKDKLYESLKEYFNANYKFKVYIKDGVYSNFSCLEIEDDTFETIDYNTPSELLENYYILKDKQDRLRARCADLTRLLNTNIERCKKKKIILEKTIEKTEQKDKLKLYGEFISSALYNMKKGDKSVEIYNYYDNCNVTIPLDPLKTPTENMQNYYKKYNKAKISEEMALEQLEKNEIELNYLNSVLTNVLMIDKYDEINDIKSELTGEGYIRFNKKVKSKIKATKPSKYVSPDGFEIYVGKNNIQNDYLTTKFAYKNDLWFHTKDIPGSHVIIRTQGMNEVPDSTLLYAANLAGYFSKGRDSTKVAVDYTEIKNVRKPNGAKPGMVIYLTNKTIFVDPKEPEKL